MALLKKNKKKEKKIFVCRHFVFIEAPVDKIWPEIVKWGEAEWWPGKCAIKFTREGHGDIEEGVSYIQEILLNNFSKFVQKKSPKWKTRITKLENNLMIERTFFGGMLKGNEVVRLGERANGTRIDYALNYKVVGSLNK